jgi:uncharacterized protein (TIGR02246 family)
MTKVIHAVSLAALIIMGILHIPAPLRAQGNSAVEQEVLKTEEERLQAFQHADAATLESIFAPEFTFVSANGEYHTLAELLSDVRTGRLKYTSLEHFDVHVRVYGDTAILTGRSGSKYIQNGKPGGAPRSYLNVYVKRDGKWRLVIRQETLMAR